jgi:predicted DNA-binding transcriptional regulator AlpA
MPDPMDVIEQDEVVRLLGAISDKTFGRMIADGEFPDGFLAGRRDKKKWYRKDVDSYLWLQMRLTQKPGKRTKKKAAEQPAEEKPK